MDVLNALVEALASGAVRVVDLTQPLGPATPVIQWIGASKCVPVCSPKNTVFQYQPGPRLS